MPILTLTTDFGYSSYHIAALKGQLLSTSKNIQIVDVSHSIVKFDKIAAAYAMKNASIKFPDNSIHFTNVNLKEGNKRYLIVKRQNQIYICPDNGMISIMFPEEDFKAYALNGLEKDFTYKQINEKLCELLLVVENNEDITSLGIQTNSYLVSPTMRAAIMGDMIRAAVIHVDEFGNLIINVTEEMFYKFVGNKQFSINVRNYRTHQIYKHYSDVVKGEMICLFNDAGYLEIALNENKATQGLGVGYGAIVLVELL